MHIIKDEAGFRVKKTASLVPKSWIIEGQKIDSLKVCE